MSAPEIAHRLMRAISTRLQRSGFGASVVVPSPDLAPEPRRFIVGNDRIGVDRHLAAADSILAGTLRVFSVEHAIAARPRWNRDPKSGREAQLSFGKTLNYRDEAVVGDIKYLWEPNRHLHLVTLAQAWGLSGNRKYLDTLGRHVASWIDQCPSPRGPNWSSSLELAIRLINWSIVWQLLGGHASILFEGSEGRRLRERWLESIYQHMHFIRGNLSRYSSANNHLIGEVAGLFIGATTWPYWVKCRRWSRDARDILEREALAQNASDGVNREQAVSYEQFVLDFLLLAGLAGRACGGEFSEAYWKRIESMLEYLASIMDVGGNLPMIGDADDGYVVRLSQEPDFDPYRSLIATGAILFRRHDFRYKAGKLDDKTRWLLGEQADDQFGELRADSESLPVRKSFPDGGYYLLGCDFESEREIRAVVDAGPLGYLSIAAHGHADALAMTLSVGGREFLIDPGTYAYHTQKQWRDYFRGTAAHNTIEIDGWDQSVSGGNFMWLIHANTRCEAWETGSTADRFVGSHDGYLPLADPVRHRREIVFEKGARRFYITDTLECRGTHRARCRWHFSELCDVELRSGFVMASNGGRSVTLKLIEPVASFELQRAQGEPPSGWVSRRFDVKVPTTTAEAAIDIHGTTSIVTEILCG